MNKSLKMFFIKLIIFIFVVSIFSMTYAAYEFLKIYVIDNGYLYQKNNGMTVEEYKEKIDNQNLQVYSKTGEMLENADNLSTGDILEENSEKNTLVLRGDLNGDGYMDENDFLAVKEHLIGKNILQDEFKEAADLDENNDVNLIDVLLFKRIKKIDSERRLESIELISKPLKTVYIQNYEELNITGGKIRLIYSDETTEEIDITSDMITGFDNSKLGDQILTISYGGKTTTFNITVVEKELVGIDVIEIPLKNTYIQNYEKLDVTGGKIRLIYNDQSTEDINMTIEMITGFDNSQLGENILTVTYEGQTTTFGVTIIEKELIGIEIAEEPSKKTYIQNYEELDITGGKIRLIYNDESTEDIDMTIEMITGFDNLELGEKTLTVTYDEQTVTFNVMIVEKQLIRIEIAEEPSKKTYIQNHEELDVTGGKIRLIYNDESTEDVTMTVDMVKGFDNTSVGEKTLTVTYEEKTATYNVTILAKALEMIEISKLPDKVTYIQNYEKLDVTGGKIRLVYVDGTTDEIDMTTNMITGFDNTTLGEKVLTVSYGEQNTTFNVTIVKKQLLDIEINKVPSKITYIQNYENLDVTGGVITLKYNDETVENIDMTVDMISGFDNTSLGEQILTVTYEGYTATFKITIIEKQLTGIEIIQEPLKKTYIQNYEDLDVAGGKIRLIYNDKTTDEIEMTREMITGFDNTTLGIQTLTVTYEGKIATYKITVLSKALSKIEIAKLPDKTTYIQNYEELDVTGGKVRLIYNDETTEEIDLTNDNVTGFDNTNLGKKTLTVTYEGKTTTFSITIVKKELEGIEISQQPSKKTYIQNYEDLNVTGGKIRLIYNDETTEEIDMTIDLVKGFDNTNLGEKTLTVTYEGKTATFNVTIVAKELIRIEIIEEPSKKTYIQNYEELDVSGGKIRLVYNDETTEEINMTENLVKGFNNANLGEQTLIVTYRGLTATFKIKIVEKELLKIEIAKEPSKKEYIQNVDNLDVTGGKIRLIYNDETSEEIDMTSDMITGFNNTNLGDQTLTVTYKGKTATYKIKIVEETMAKLDKTNIELNAGEETTLTIITTPENVDKKYDVHIENSLVVKLEKTETFGVLKITGLAKGTSKITFVVTVDGTEFNLECNVTVNAPDIPVTEVKLNKTEITLEKGQTDTITATILPENATNRNLNWSTDNKDIVGLKSAQDGTLTIEAVSEGEATITVKADDGKCIATCKVTVIDSSSEDILQLNKTNVTIPSGQTAEIVATMPEMNQDINWNSSNTLIAKITGTENNKITITGNKAGKTTITATTEDGNYTATCEINVVYPIKDVTIVEDTDTVAVGSKTLLTKVLNPINATNQNVTWKSSDETIAKVNEYGIVEGIKEGDVTITVTTEDGNHQATCEVSVENKTEETPASEFTYIVQNGKIKITGYKGSDTEVVIPEEIDGRTVEQIGNGFSEVTGFDDVNSIILPDTVKTIGRLAFRGNSNLQRIDLKNVELIDVSAFKETGLTKITLPDTLTEIRGSAFSKCANLECDIIIPDSVTSMGSETFAECSKIKTVKFSKNCSIIPERAFYKSGLTGPLEFPEGVEIIDAHSFYATQCTSVKFADSIKYIYRNAFRQCSSKMEGELVLPKNLILWGDALFDHARNFTNTTIVIPKSVKVIGGDVAPTTYPYEYTEETTGYGTHTFYDLATYGLKEFVVEEGNEYFKAIDGVLFSKDTKRLVAFPPAKILENGVYEIPEGVEQIDELSFSLAGYSGFTGNLKTLKLPSTFKVSEFGPDNIMCTESKKDQVCYNTLSVGLYIYNGIKEVIVSEDNPTLKSIDGCVYSKDGSTLWYVPLQKTGTLNIPEGTTKIARGSFAEGYGTCPLALTGLNIPASVMEIDEDTLPWINKLPSRCVITVDENNPYWGVNSNGDIVAKSLESIEILSEPTKTKYIQNSESLDLTGAKIKLIYNDGSTAEKDITQEMVSGFNNKELGRQTLTVTYEGKTATFEITIIEERTAKLDKTNIELDAGEETTLTIITTPDDVDKNYDVEIENSLVVKLEKTDTFGVLKLTGLTKGTSKLTFVVTVDGTEFNLECNVTVNAPDIPVTGIKLNKTEITLEKGQTDTITATILPENATNTSFIWTTDNKDIVELKSTQDGTLTIEAISAGDTIITATTQDGNYTANCKIKVIETIPEEPGMQLDKTNETISKGQTIDITAIKTGIDQSINWSTSNKVIANITKTVNDTITVTGGSAGKATITATTEDGKYTATCEINVVYPVTGITINEENETVTVGSKTLLTSVLNPINATNQNVTWTSSDGKIATVNEYGIVEGIAEGNVTITAKAEDGNYQATCEVTVEGKKEEAQASKFTYSTKGNKITITGYKGNDRELVIPQEIDGKEVETIGEGSKISGLNKVTSIELPSTAKTIGISAFNGYTNILNIDLKNIETIGSSAFYNCTGLEKITLPDTLKSIGGYAFYGCTSLNCNLIIPDSVTSMDGAYIFRGCSNLKKLKLSKNCTKIPYAAFYESGLTGPLKIPEGVKIIDGYAFSYTYFTSVKFADSVEYIYENAFRQCSTKMEGEIVLPKNLIYWGDGQFDHARNCTNTSLVIPKNLKTIGGDQNISSMYQKVNTGYGTHSFYDFAIKSFTEFIVEEGNQYFQAIDGVLYSKDTKRLVAFPAAKILEDGIFEMPEGVEKIDELSFSLAGLSGYSTGNLKTVVLPSTFTISEYGPDNLNCSVGNKDRGICFNTLSSGFYIYNGIKEVIVSEDNPDYKSIDGCVYSKDGSTLWYVPLQKTGNLEIPEGTTKIGHGAFYGAYSSCPIPISSLYIPSSVKDIDQYTLEYMNLLPSRCTITVDENNPYWKVNSSGDVVKK